MKKRAQLLVAVILPLFLTACPHPPKNPFFFLPPSGGGGVTSFQIGGTVQGLGANDSVTLRLNDDSATDLTVTSNTGFEFAQSVNSGGAYKVLVSAATTNCVASNNSGTVDGSSVTNVSVVCSDTTYALKVNVSGMEPGNSFTVQNNGTDDLLVSANGISTFSKPVPAAGGYAVIVSAGPSGGDTQTCTPSANTGVVSGVTTVDIVCGPAYYSLSGSYEGLAGVGLKIKVNNTDEVLTFGVPADAADASFTFTKKLAAGVSYAIVVSQQPSNLNQNCTVKAGASGTISGNVTNIHILCEMKKYVVSGTVSGLSGSDAITVQLNGVNDQSLSPSSTSFSWPVDDGTVYSVSVVANPAGKTCGITNGTGTIAGADKTNVSISCEYNKYTVGGAVSGLCSGQTITIRNNGGSSTLVSGATPSFTFPSQNDLSSYAVTVYSAPSGVTCSVTNGTGTLGGSNVSNVAINCTGCNSCNGSGSLTVSWTASRSYDVNDASGGGHKVYYKASPSVTGTEVTVVDVPNTTSKTSTAIPGLNKGCTYYVRVKGYSAINPTGGTLSSEVSRNIP